MVTVEYFGSDPPRIIDGEEDADFVPEIGDEVCLPPDNDRSNDYTGGWHAFEVRNRRYYLEAGKVVCYVEG